VTAAPLVALEQPEIDESVGGIRSDDFESWRALMSDSFVPVTMSAQRADHFHGVVRRRVFGDVSVVELAAQAQTFERTPGLIAATDTPFFIVTLQLAGTGMVLQDNREAVLRPGDLAIFDSNRAHTRTHETNFRSLTFRLPQNFMDLPRETIGQLTATRFPGDEGMGPLVGPFLSQISHALDCASAASKRRLINNAIDVIATLLHHELGDHAEHQVSPQRSLLVAQIHEFIESNLGNGDLTPSDIAAANFISTRHLHSIFKDQGITVSAWIRHRRLSHCYRDLADPMLMALPISSIALRWGFSDPSQFSRVFRKSFGESARDVRKKAGF
jgi:AraC-like DNA-binding protein